jgi:hypothetical protein
MGIGGFYLGPPILFLFYCYALSQSFFIFRKALPFKLSELLSEKMLIKHTTRANLIFKILFRG